MRVYVTASCVPLHNAQAVHDSNEELLGDERDASDGATSDMVAAK